MIEVIKDHWCIEDQIRPSFGRKIQLTVDLYTDESILKFPVTSDLEESILQLKIYGVNLGRELTYTKSRDYIEIDLGDLRNWTSTKDSRGLTRVRVKLFIRLMSPHFKLSAMDLGYKTQMEFFGYKMAKGSIIVPPGLKIANDGEIKIKSHYKVDDELKHSQEKIIADHVDTYKKRKRYNYTVKKEFKDILESEESAPQFKVSYRTINDKKFLIIPFISFALLILALFRSYGMIMGTIKFDIRYLAASVAFLGLILNFARDGYELPLRKMIFFSILVLIIELALELIFLPYG